MSRTLLIPNLCTAVNLLLGVSAIAAVFNRNVQLGVVFIVLAAVLDRMDGILARRYNAVSDFGKEFDSLADLVSFGVAPASLLYLVLMEEWSTAGLVCFGLFTLCGALRLARFNVTGSTTHFQGVPITAAGSLLAVIIILIPNSAVILTAGILLSFAMISTIRIPKI